MARFDGSDEVDAREALDDGKTQVALVYAVLALCARVDDLATLIGEEIARAAR